MTIAAIIVAAGRGTRAGGDIPKQWQDLRGQPVIAYTIAAIRPHVDEIVVVLHADDAARWDALDVTADHIVIGAATRDGSVRAGLDALSQSKPDKVLIHDAARPLVSQTVITDVIAALDTHQGAAPALPVTDAIWTGADGVVTGTKNRDGLFRAQTPQGFQYSTIVAAHDALNGPAADDVAVARAYGVMVAIVAGDEQNMKITDPRDFSRAANMLGRDMDVRCGNGYDVHRFGDGDHVWLCGVKVPHGRSLQGHSDADVGMHAVTDAIYGALGQGDIGQHFPPTDPQWKGAQSHIFLRHAVDLATSLGFKISNIDCTLVCEYPKIGPHQPAMKAALADIMGLDAGRISVKATTSERLGFTGREEGIASIATATLVKS
ncbi:MAG: bifunctional 2-C-methyl-D-erythritol 4-phosphate cytidylyltransferase/2-C-methyl-D-erythritol 2,4-cyclodiphosphate synthase [Yoonia sp.]